MKTKNKYISKYIYERTILDFISNYNYVKNEKDFINYIITILGYNIKYFLDKEMNKYSLDYYKSIKFINHITQNYINYYKSISNTIISPKLKDYAISFLDYQVIIQKKENKDIQIINKRCLQDFIETSKQFLNDNYYYIAQKEYINYILTNFGVILTDFFNHNIKTILKEELKTNKIQDLIDKCFMTKFNEFENRVNDSFKNSIIIQSYNENLINGQNYDLPSYSEITTNTKDTNPYNKISI